MNVIYWIFPDEIHNMQFVQPHQLSEKNKSARLPAYITILNSLVVSSSICLFNLLSFCLFFVFLSIRLLVFLSFCLFFFLSTHHSDWRVSNPKSHSLRPNYKVAVSESVTSRLGRGLPGQGRDYSEKLCLRLKWNDFQANTHVQWSICEG